MLQLKIVKGPQGSGRSFSLPSGVSVTIGRAESCDIRLPSAGISKTHCRLTAQSGSRIEVEDLGSSNGTFVNGLLIKKHFLKPGDTLTISDFTLSVSIEAPSAEETPGDSFATPSPNDAMPASPPPPDTFAQKVNRWIAANIFPWADRLSSRFDVRMLMGSFFLIWSTLIILITVSPFSQKANERVRDQAVEVGRLYARQIVERNKQTLIEQRYRDLVVDLDLRKGQTPGLLDAMILDVGKAQILAPTELLGRNLPNKQAFMAITKDIPFVQFDDDGIAYISEPLRLKNTEGTILTVATVMVTFDVQAAQFTFASLLDQAVTSLLYALLLSVLLFILLYRWIEGSLNVVSSHLDESMRSGEHSLSSPVIWPALSHLCELISAALAKGHGGADALHGGTQDHAWAMACTEATQLPAAVFDTQLVVLAWNTSMERLIGIRATMAIGSDISGASRDVAFEASIRELSAQSLAVPWQSFRKRIEFSGVFYEIVMISDAGCSFVTIQGVEE